MPDISNQYSLFSRYSADLCLFLLVAQHGQLSKAAKVATISQPRMSQRMRFLEDSLGLPLFIRQQRGVKLTTAGLELAEALSRPMADAAQVFQNFQTRPNDREVVILSDIAFASFRLLPDFTLLTQSFEDLNISLVTTQMPDVQDAPDADLIIRMEPLHKLGAHEVCLFRERVSAVCSRTYKDAHSDMMSAADLLDKTLITLSAKNRTPWFSWGDWLQENDCSHSPSQSFMAFSSYDHVIGTALSGLGVALGWEGLIEVDTPTSALVRAIPPTIESDRGYFLKIAPGKAQPNTEHVFDWLSDRFAQRL